LHVCYNFRPVWIIALQQKLHITTNACWLLYIWDCLEANQLVLDLEKLSPAQVIKPATQVQLNSNYTDNINRMETQLCWTLNDICDNGMVSLQRRFGFEVLTAMISTGFQLFILWFVFGIRISNLADILWVQFIAQSNRINSLRGSRSS